MRVALIFLFSCGQPRVGQRSFLAKLASGRRHERRGRRPRLCGCDVFGVHLATECVGVGVVGARVSSNEAQDLTPSAEPHLGRVLVVWAPRAGEGRDHCRLSLLGLGQLVGLERHPEHGDSPVIGLPFGSFEEFRVVVVVDGRGYGVVLDRQAAQVGGCECSQLVLGKAGCRKEVTVCTLLSVEQVCFPRGWEAPARGHAQGHPQRSSAPREG